MSEPRKCVASVCHTNMSNPLGDTEIADSGLRKDSVKKVRIEKDPASSVRQHLAGSSPPNPKENEGANLTITSIRPSSDIERKDRMLGELDYIRNLVESSRLNRVRLMVKARAEGWSCHEIGAALGITEDAVRKAIKRAGDLD